ncbi:MAG: hypothetical protein RL272_341 [Candidatus Parcubacteria bacterium]
MPLPSGDDGRQRPDVRHRSGPARGGEFRLRAFERRDIDLFYFCLYTAGFSPRVPISVASGQSPFGDSPGEPGPRTRWLDHECLAASKRREIHVRIVAGTPCIPRHATGATDVRRSLEWDGPADECHEHRRGRELDQEPEQLDFCFPAHIAARLRASYLCQKQCDLFRSVRRRGADRII